MIIGTYLVAFSATNMHIYHKVAIGHLMQAWARFALQCFSLYQVLCISYVILAHVGNAVRVEDGIMHEARALSVKNCYYIA